MHSFLDMELFFKQSLDSIGHPFNGNIVFDSDWQRYGCPESKSSKTSAGYKVHSDGKPTLKFWCGKCGLSESFSFDEKYEHEPIHIDHQEAIRKKNEREQLAIVTLENARDELKKLWDLSTPCNSHPYIYSKQMSISEEDGLRVTFDGVLLCPVSSVNGDLISLQRIYWDKTNNKFEKRFFKGLSPKNGFHLFGDLASHRQVYFAEGIATALAINKATNKPVICVYGKHFDTIAPIMAKAYPDRQFIYCADADLVTSTKQTTSEDNANKAVSNIGGEIRLPDFSAIPKAINLETSRSDFNDLYVLLLAHGFSKDAVLIELKRQLTVPSILHTQLLKHLIEKITPVDFRSLAEIDEKEKLQVKHYVVIVVEMVLKLAKTLNWGICRNHEFIYLFNGEYWNLIDEEELTTFLGTAAEKMGVDKSNARYFNFRDQLYKQFIAVANLPKPERPHDTVIINLLNGTFEITSEKTVLREFRSSDFMPYQLGFDYNPEAKAPLFAEYLNKVLPDKKKQEILAEYLGYVFIRPTTLKLEKTLLLYGSGANGKSVFYEIVRKLLGSQNTSEFSLQSLTNDNGYYRAMIANKLVNYASEINGKLETSIFKQLVSGEPVEARLPYGRPFTVTDYAKMIFNCNELPKDVEQTEAYFRRFLIIPFEITIPEAEQDKQLAQKIIANELSGVFNWVLDGLQRIIKQKQFTDCESVRHAREQYERESDSVKQFIFEYGYQTSTIGYSLIKTLYEEYRSFCSDDGFKPVNKMNFSKRLKSMKINLERKNFGNIAFLVKPK
ncbi:phage/plasmid primase, P4 family [Legionella feeleii]|uniref:5' DNA primase TraC n=1 Tax=Legionella feeleii TaxID=453 RepID=A0A378IRY1_9GAMM|nr:phage/plasmid primase, P4 family [Legionella feeleii]STX37710.1 5' DNA primase TraC [Legionella feeleii]